MHISKNAMVTIRYCICDTEGFLKTPLEPETIAYVHGQGHMMPSVERLLEGKNAGERLEVILPPQEVFGEFKESLLVRVPKNHFLGIPKVKPGIQFDLPEKDGSTKTWTIVRIEEDSIILNGNHPLAGLHIKFDIDILHVH